MNTERDNWRDIAPEDATDAELELVHKIMGPRPAHISPEQWRDNMRACAASIRKHVTSEKGEPRSLGFNIGGRDYWVGYDHRNGNAWQIISRGDRVHSVSTLHYGEVGAFKFIADALVDIEARWAAVQESEQRRNLDRWASQRTPERP